MATAKLVRARRNADTARRVKNNWKKQFFEMRDHRDALLEELEKRSTLLDIRQPANNEAKPNEHKPVDPASIFESIERLEFAERDDAQ